MNAVTKIMLCEYHDIRKYATKRRQIPFRTTFLPTHRPVTLRSLTDMPLGVGMDV